MRFLGVYSFFIALNTLLNGSPIVKNYSVDLAILKVLLIVL